jgi:hypothetical protein
MTPNDSSKRSQHDMTRPPEGPPRGGCAAGPEVVCLAANGVSDSTTRPKFQTRISRGTPPRENACHGSNHGGQSHGRSWPRKDYTNETHSTANRILRQAVLDRQRHRSGMALSWAIRGRNRGACVCDPQKRLESIAPLDPANAPNAPASFSLKSRRGPSSRRPPQCRRRLSVQGGRGDATLH